jgi:hypothetical protein
MLDEPAHAYQFIRLHFSCRCQMENDPVSVATFDR